MAGPDQQQLCQHRDAKGCLNMSFLCTDLVHVQAKVRLQFPGDLLYGPPALIGTHDLSRGPLVQIGHQDFGMFRATVTPFFTQHHDDVADVAQTQTFAVYPEGLTPLSTRETEDTRPLIMLARHMRDQVFQGLALDCFPRPSHRQHKLPTPVGGVGIALHDHLHVHLGAIRRSALNDNALGPDGRAKVAHHLTEQRIFRPVLWMGFHAYQTKGYGEAIDVPCGN
jgi:hypothetical protein